MALFSIIDTAFAVTASMRDASGIVLSDSTKALGVKRSYEVYKLTK
jgi:hypothetical protein